MLSILVAAFPLFGAIEPVTGIRARLEESGKSAVVPCTVEGAVVGLASSVGETRPGFFLEDDSGGILVWQRGGEIEIGDRVRAAGACAVAAHTRTELDAESLEVLESGMTPLKPRRLFPEEARSPEWQSTIAEVDGVVSEVQGHGDWEYVSLRGQVPLRALIRIADRTPVQSNLEPGMRVILRGIIAPQKDSAENPRPHELILRSEDDLVVVDTPIQSGRQFLYLFLSLGVLAAVWIVSLQRAVQERTRELKEALRKAEESSHMKSSFVANMSHEIRTPLNAIIGFTDLLQDEAQGEQKRVLDIIRVSANTLLGVINDVLDFSKIESGKLDLALEPVALQSIVEEALDMIAPAAANKGLDIGYLIEGSIPRRIRTDPARLRQVLMNLLSNAVKFTDAGTVEVVLAGEPEAEGKVRLYLAVKDSGIGIPSEQLSRLFQPFEQLDSSASRRHGGSGLGLVISRHLIRMMQGDLFVGSTPGKGSTFTASLVCEVEESADPPLGLPPDLTFAVQVQRPWTAKIVASLLQGAGAKTVPAEQASVVISDRPPRASELRDGRRWIELSARMRRRSQKSGHSVVTLPVKPAELWGAIRSTPLAIAESGPAESKPAPLRILVADDNPVNLKVVTSLLARLGQSAEVATNGKEVLVAMEKRPFDLVFLDVQMPEMDGLEAARRIREQEHLRNRPWLIALTANAMNSDREECLAAGMNDHVPKPIGLKQLAAALGRAESGLEEANTPHAAPPLRARGASVEL